MISKRDLKASKFLSLVLRHKPEKANITLDEQGYVEVNLLIEKMNEQHFNVTEKDIDRIVDEDDKMRYSYAFINDKKCIRANQGHSIHVELHLKEVKEPITLFHGTACKNMDSIFKTGIMKRNRNFVHLTDSISTAEAVGSRYGNPMIFTVNAHKMIEDGYKIYISENGVYLTDYVPLKYISVLI